MPSRLLHRRAQAPIGRGARRRVEMPASATARGRGTLLVRAQRRGAECGCAAERGAEEAQARRAEERAAPAVDLVRRVSAARVFTHYCSTV